MFTGAGRTGAAGRAGSIFACQMAGAVLSPPNFSDSPLLSIAVPPLAVHAKGRLVWFLPHRAGEPGTPALVPAAKKENVVTRPTPDAAPPKPVSCFRRDKSSGNRRQQQLGRSRRELSLLVAGRRSIFPRHAQNHRLDGAPLILSATEGIHRIVIGARRVRYRRNRLAALHSIPRPDGNPDPGVSTRPTRARSLNS